MLADKLSFNAILVYSLHFSLLHCDLSILLFYLCFPLLFGFCHNFHLSFDKKCILFNLSCKSLHLNENVFLLVLCFSFQSESTIISNYHLISFLFYCVLLQINHETFQKSTWMLRGYFLCFLLIFLISLFCFIFKFIY